MVVKSKVTLQVCLTCTLTHIRHFHNKLDIINLLVKSTLVLYILGNKGNSPQDKNIHSHSLPITTYHDETLQCNRPVMTNIEKTFCSDFFFYRPGLIIRNIDICYYMSIVVLDFLKIGLVEGSPREGGW